MKMSTTVIYGSLAYILLVPAAQSDAERGRQFWNQPFVVDGQQRSCTSCHGSNPREVGKHQRTGKPIEPMSPAVNPQRLTDQKKMQKWFTRNCKWTLGRECTVQEQADVIEFLSNS